MAKHSSTFRRSLIIGGILAAVVLVVFVTWEQPRQEGAVAALEATRSEARADGVLAIDTSDEESAPVARISAHSGARALRAPDEESAPVAKAEETPDDPDPIAEALTATSSDRAVAHRLLRSLPDVPVERQPELFSHVMNLLPDGDFGMIRPILLESRTSPDVVEILYAEILNRPNAVKLPLLVDVAFQSQHPLASEARDTLELLLGEDYGDNRMAWDKKVAEELRDEEQDRMGVKGSE